MWIRSLILGVVVLGWSVLVALAGEARKPREVTIGWFNNPGYVKLAAAQGWFEREMGVEKVIFKEFDSGGQLVAAMASGTLDIGVELGSTPFTAAISQNVPIEMVWPNDLVAEHMVGRDSSNIRTVKDLVGKKVGVPFGSTSHFILLGALEHFGVDPKRVQIFDMGPPDILAAWKRGDIDAAVVWHPVQQEIDDDGGHIVITAGEVAKLGYPAFDLAAVTRRLIKEQPAMVLGLVRAHAKAARMICDEPQKSAQIVGKYLSLPADSTGFLMSQYTIPCSARDAASASWMGTSATKGKATLTRGLNATIKFLKSRGTIRSGPEDAAPYVNTRFVEEVAREGL